MHQKCFCVGRILFTILAIIPSILSPGNSHPVTETPGLGIRQSPLMGKLCRRIMTVPDINALTDPEEMILLHKNKIVTLTKRSTILNKSSMKGMRSFWAYNMTSPKYRRTISPHPIVINGTMSSKEMADLQFMRWREPFLMKPMELMYYQNLRKKFHFNYKRQCPACRQIVLDTYEQYNQHSFEYDERGYVRPVTAPATIRYNYDCYICPSVFASFEQMARHYVSHSVQIAKYKNFSYPYTAEPTRARRKTSIVHMGGETLYFNVFPDQDDSTEFPKWIRTPPIV